VRLRVQPWHLVAGLVLICIAAVAGVYRFRTRGEADPAQMVSYLPTKNAVVAYIDFDAIRRAGILNMVAGSKAAEELEYQQFVGQTLFDYRQDLDAAALSFAGDQVFLVLRGRFHWKNLMDYVVRQGGLCHNGYCAMDGSRRNRRISFYPIRPNLMAMAVGKNDEAAYSVGRNSGRLALSPPDQPIWIVVPAVAVKDASTIPDAVKPYASALKNADEVVLSISPREDHLQLSVKVTCKDAIAASSLLVDVENATSALRKMINGERQMPGPGDLRSVLIGGAFRRDDRRVYGEWPISRAFVDSVTSEAY
jgi:hypothetical protein